MRTAKNYNVRYKIRKAKEKKLQKELEKVVKLILKQNERITDISINAVSVKEDGRKFVNGLSWSREDLIKPKKIGVGIMKIKFGTSQSKSKAKKQ